MNAAHEPEDLVDAGLMSTVMRGARYSAAGYITAQVLYLGAYVAIARLIDPSEFGVYAAATALIGFAMLISETGMASAIVHRRDSLEEALNTAFLATIAGGLAFSLLALATAPLLGLFFGDDTVTAIAAAMSGIILLRTLTSVPDGLLQRRFSFLRRLIIEPAAVVAFAAGGIIGAANGMGPWALVVAQYASVSTDFLLSWGLVRWRPRPRLATRRMWRELVGYGRHVLAASMILRAGEQADAFIIGKVVGTAALGQFRYGLRLAATPFQAFLAVAAYVLFPAFSRIADNRERFVPAVIRALRWVCALSFPASLILIPLGEPLAVLVFGEVWRDAGIVAASMCAYAAGGMVVSVVTEALKADGQPNRLTPIHTLTTLVTVGGLLALAPLGLAAAGLALSLGTVTGALYALREARDRLGIPISATLPEVAWPAFASAVMAAVAFFGAFILDPQNRGVAEGLALTALIAAGGFLVYAVTLRAVARETWNDLAGTLRNRSYGQPDDSGR